MCHLKHLFWCIQGHALITQAYIGLDMLSLDNFLVNKSFENAVGKGEIARNEQFLLFPVFSTVLDNFLPFSSNVKLLSAKSSSLGGSKKKKFFFFGGGGGEKS